jgi:hypothetical protein
MRMPAINTEKLTDFENLANKALVVRMRDGSNGAKGDKHGALLEINTVLKQLFPEWWEKATPPEKAKLGTGFKRRMTAARRGNLNMCVTTVKRIAFDNDVITNPPKTFADALQYVSADEKHMGVYVTINRDGLIPVAARKLAMRRADGVIKHGTKCFKTWDNAGILGAKAKAATELTTTGFALLLAEKREERALLTA